MLLLKKCLARLLFPLPLAVEIILVGLVLLWLTRRQRLGRALVTTGTLLLILFTAGPFGDLILRPLESEHPVLSDPERVVSHAGDRTRWVLVLAAGYAPEQDLPLNVRAAPRTLARLVEGVRVHHRLAGSKLAVSLPDTVSEEEMASLLGALGVARQDSAFVRGARDTDEESALFRALVGDDPAVLVTSASHMPRALGYFHDRGMRPVPAPTQHQAVAGGFYDTWFPGATGATKTETAFYEYLGLAWVWLTR